MSDAVPRPMCLEWLVTVSLMVAVPTALSAQTVDDIAAPAPEPLEEPVAPLANLSARLAYNSDRGALVGASVQTDRLFGDHRLRFSIEASEEALRYNLAYAAPELFGQNPQLGLRLFAAQTVGGDSFDFDSQTVGFEPRLTWLLSDNAKLAAYVGLSWSEIDSVSPIASILIRNNAGDRARQVIGLDYDRSLGFGHGALQRLVYGVTAEIGQTDRDHEFTQLSARFGAGWLLGAEDGIALRAQVRGATIITTDGTSHIGDRLMLGSSTIRGFAFGGFGPRDLAVAGEPALGGNHFAAARVDAQFSGFDGADRLLPGVFLDMGSLWGLDDNSGGLAGANPVDDGLQLRGSAGITLDLQTAIGPITFSYAHPFERESYDRVQEFGISYSRRF